MGYTLMKNNLIPRNYVPYSLEHCAVQFIREACEGLRFETVDESKALQGKSIRPNQIPFNMEKDIDRLCFENAVDRFLKSGKKEDAFDVYFCYLEMFIGDYEKTRRMIELLSEFEANGSGLLMKHRDHYSHSVYVFCLGLAIYESNDLFREAYKGYYKIEDGHAAACHYLQYWGLASLFHDIGYPFELPFEQVCSYFEVDGDRREGRPFVAYHALEAFAEVNEAVKEKLKKIIAGREFLTTDEVFAFVLADKLGDIYQFTEQQMLTYLVEKPTQPDKFNHFMDHAYFSATILFKKLFEEKAVTRRELFPGVWLRSVHTSKFKSSYLSITLLAPLDKKTAGANALIQGTAMLTLSQETRDMAGGLTLRDGNVEVNCAFETQLRVLREEMAAQVAGILFP